MLIKDVPFTLKDGRGAVLRSAREEDAAALLEYLIVSAGETDFIMRYPEECGKYSLEGEKDFINSANNDPNKVMMVCEIEGGRLAGNCALHFNSAMKTKHRASVAIALISEFWNLGIGTKMFQEMIRIAQERGGVLQLELEFVEGNSRARALYEKMGFRIAGMRPNAIRLKNGELRHEYIMTREMK